jgi:hypothetical protein
MSLPRVRETPCKPVGVLINFNVPMLKDGIKRVLNPEITF